VNACCYPLTCDVFFSFFESHHPSSKDSSHSYSLPSRPWHVRSNTLLLKNDLQLDASRIATMSRHGGLATRYRAFPRVLVFHWKRRMSAHHRAPLRLNR